MIFDVFDIDSDGFIDELDLFAAMKMVDFSEIKNKFMNKKSDPFKELNEK
jgi:Ca2+-binding EF-hand superfamily protein